MTTDRMSRVNELLRREIGEALFHVTNDSDFDLAAVTVTRVIASRNLRHARVLVSIMGHHDQRARMMSMLRKQRCEMQRRINSNLNLKYTPRLSFELDTSLERGDQILSLLAEIEKESNSEQNGMQRD